MSEVANRLVGPSGAAHIKGAVVAIDVIRAFTTAAYAFAAGAREIFLVADVDDALALRRRQPRLVLVGEDRGRRPEGFDFSNSPVAVAGADLTGRSVVLRTTAGTRGALAAKAADRLWCACLVVASATASAVLESGLAEPTYVITGWLAEGNDAADDVATARVIERARLGLDLDTAATLARVTTSEEAARTLALGAGHVHPDDIVFATRIDAFDFAMEVSRVGERPRLITG